MSWRLDRAPVEINLPGDDAEWWVKFVDMLQQNWALLVLNTEGIDAMFV